MFYPAEVEPKASPVKTDWLGLKHGRVDAYENDLSLAVQKCKHVKKFFIERFFCFVHTLATYFWEWKILFESDRSNFKNDF